VVALDRADALQDAPDLRRVAASRTDNGGVRVALSLADRFTARDLLAAEDTVGPPGSICVRLWTVSRPGATPPDLLACVTARADGRALRSTISREAPGTLPVPVGSATLTRPSTKSVALVVAPELIGRARRVAFAAEATRPGCARVRCVDSAPDKGTKTLRMR